MRPAPIGRLSRRRRGWGGARGPAHCGGRRLFPQGAFAGGARRARARRQGRRRARRKSKSPKRRARAPRPTSSPPPKAPRCISTACASRRAISIRPCATGCIAGAMVPATLVVKAQNFRRWYRERVLELFESCDAILAPATPCTAPKIGQQTFTLDGVEMPVRPNIGHLHAADLLHRPAGGGGAGAAHAAADRGADHRRALARGYRAAHRACAGADGRGRGAATQSLRRKMEIDLPEVVAEVRAAFDATRTRWWETTSLRSTNCSATIRAPFATAAAKISTAMPRSRRSAPRARRWPGPHA